MYHQAQKVRPSEQPRRIPRQQHGFITTTDDNGNEVVTPRYRDDYIKHVDVVTTMRQAFEDAGHPRVQRSRAGRSRAAGWWIHRAERGGKSNDVSKAT